MKTRVAGLTVIVLLIEHAASQLCPCNGGPCSYCHDGSSSHHSSSSCHTYGVLSAGTGIH